MQNTKSIADILALMFEECRDGLCLDCLNHPRQSRKEIIQKYEAEIYEYLKSQGIFNAGITTDKKDR